MCVTFNTVEDSIAESTEEFVIELLRSSSLNAEDSTTVRITDNDGKNCIKKFSMFVSKENKQA